MKKCQMHNKKKRQALLYCNAALFGCNWRLCLSFFGPSPWFQATGSWMSYADFLCNRQRLPQPPCAYAIWPPAQRPLSDNLGAPSSVAAGLFSSTLLALVELVPVWKPAGSPCIYWGGGAGAPPICMMLLDLPRLSRSSERDLEEHELPW